MNKPFFCVVEHFFENRFLAKVFVQSKVFFLNHCISGLYMFNYTR